MQLDRRGRGASWSLDCSNFSGMYQGGPDLIPSYNGYMTIVWTTFGADWPDSCTNLLEVRSRSLGGVERATGAWDHQEPSLGVSRNHFQDPKHISNASKTIFRFSPGRCVPPYFYEVIRKITMSLKVYPQVFLVLSMVAKLGWGGPPPPILNPLLNPSKDYRAILLKISGDEA